MTFKWNGDIFMQKTTIPTEVFAFACSISESFHQSEDHHTITCINLQCLHEGYLHIVRRWKCADITIWGPQRGVSISMGRQFKFKRSLLSDQPIRTNLYFFQVSEAKTEGGGVFPPFEAVFITRFDWVNCCLCYDWSDVTSSLLVSR